MKDRMSGRIALALAVLAGFGFAPARAEDLVFRAPAETPAPPPVSRSVDGTWSYASSCDSGGYTGTAQFSGTTGALRGSGVTTKVSALAVSGNAVSFKSSYDLFGAVEETWTGRLDAAGNAITGTMSDTTGDTCTFTMTR